MEQEGDLSTWVDEKSKRLRKDKGNCRADQGRQR